MNELDVPSLNALPRLLQLRSDEWPSPDLVLRLIPASSPVQAVAGAGPMRLVVSIQNIGGQNARYVHGTVVAGCTIPARQRFDLLTSVPAGDTVTIERAVGPSGPSICASVCLFTDIPGEMGGGFRSGGLDAVPDDNCATFLFGPMPPLENE